MTVIFDPIEARSFATWLENESTQVGLDLLATDTAIFALEESWKDKKYDRYRSIFQDSSTQLRIVLGHAIEYASYLRERARMVEEYLDD